MTADVAAAGTTRAPSRRSRFSRPLVPPHTQLPRHVRLLLAGLREPGTCPPLPAADWELLVSAARQARLLGSLAARLRRAGLLDVVPAPMRHHLDGALMLAAFKRRMVRFECETAARALRHTGVSLILLKGAAYIEQGCEFSEGRLPEDADVMVDRRDLPRVEQALLAAGWRFEKTDPYDQHFYRAWSHELPPMRFPGHAAELDLHHTILPPLGRLKPNAAALVADSVEVGDGPFRVLCGPDQVLHASAHLFHDSDCTNRLRDLFDIAGLVRAHAATEAAFWDRLTERAQRHQLGEPLSIALRFARDWFDLEVPPTVAALLLPATGSWFERRLLGAMTRVMPPGDPDVEPTFADRTASRLLDLRAVWRRMPPHLVGYHAVRKAFRRAPPTPET